MKATYSTSAGQRCLRTCAVARWRRSRASKASLNHSTATTSNVTNATGNKANFRRRDRRCRFIAV